MRPKTTGKFKSRRALEDRVVFLHEKGFWAPQIGRHCQISPPTATEIIKAHYRGQTISARVEAGELLFDVEADVIDRDYFDPSPIDLEYLRCREIA